MDLALRPPPESRRLRARSFLSAARETERKPAWLGLEFIMKRKRSRPPPWFAPAVVMGALAAGAAVAALIASTM